MPNEPIDPLAADTAEPVDPLTEPVDPLAAPAQSTVDVAAPPQHLYGGTDLESLQPSPVHLGAPGEVTAVEPDTYRLSQGDAEKADLIKSIFDQSWVTDKDRSGAMQRFARIANLKTSVVADHFDEMKDSWNKVNFDAVRWMKEYPALAKLVVDHPELAMTVERDQQLSLLHQGLDWVKDHDQIGFMIDHPELSTGTEEDFRAAFARDIAERHKPKKQTFVQDEQSDALKEGWTVYTAGGAALPVPNRLVVPFKRFGEMWDQMNLSKAKYELMLRRDVGADTYELENRIHDMQLSFQQKDYNEGPVEQILTDAFQAAASSANPMLTEAAPLAAAGAVAVGGLTFAATRSPKLALDAGLSAASFFGQAGQVYGTFQLESGSAYGDMIDHGLDERHASVAAKIYGTLASGIEFASWGPMFRALGPVGALMKEGSATAFTKALLQQQGFRKVLKNFVAEGAAEGGEEFLQDATQQAVEYFARAHQFGWENADSHAGVDLNQSLEAGVKGAIGGWGLGLVHSGIHMTTRAMLRDRAKESANVVELLSNVESATTDADPDAVAEMVEHLNPGLKNLYLEPQAFMDESKRLNQDPVAMLDQALGPNANGEAQGEAALNSALSTNTKIEVPLPKFLDWQQKDLKRAMAAHTVTDPRLATPKQIDEKALDDAAKSLVAAWDKGDVDDEPESLGEKDFLAAAEAHLATVTGDAEEARQKMQLTRATLRTWAQRFGQDASQLFRDAAIQVMAGTNPTMMEVLSARAANEDFRTQGRTEELYRDTPTGLPNRAAYLATPRKPGHVVGHLSFEGVKWNNDNGNHEQTDLIMSAVAQALDQQGLDAHRVGAGDFAFDVKDAAHVQAAISTARAALPEDLRGFAITGAVGPTLEAAAYVNQAQIDSAVAKGERANPRPVLLDATGEPILDAEGEEQVLEAERPKGLREGATPSALAEKVKGIAKATPKLADALRARAEGLSSIDYFNEAYVDPDTGTWTKKAWDAMPRKKHVASLDVSGLRRANLNYSKAVGDKLLFLMKFAAQEQGGSVFDFTQQHGDEFCAQSDDPKALEAFVEAVRARLNGLAVPFQDPETGELTYIPLEFHNGFSDDYSLETADADLNERKERLKKARAAGLARRESPAPVRSKHRGVEGGAQGALEQAHPATGSDAASAEEIAAQPFVARPSLTANEARADDYTRARAYIARASTNKAEAKAWFRWCVDLKGKGESPKVSWAVESTMARYGVVDPINGFSGDESGRDMAGRIIKGNPRRGGGLDARKARAAGQGLTGRAADAQAEAKSTPMGRNIFTQAPDHTTLFYQFPTAEERQQEHPLQPQLDEHEAKLRDRRGSEAAVVLDGQGHVLFEHSSDEERVVTFKPEQIQSLIDDGNATLSHNHPSGSSLSVDDIYLAIAGNLREIRAVAPDGKVWRLARPSGGWGVDLKLHVENGVMKGDAESLAALRELRRNLERQDRGAMQVARWNMDGIVKAAGGNPLDGEQAKGFTAAKWREVKDDALVRSFNEFSDVRGWGWSIESLEPGDRGVGRDAEARRRAADVRKEAKGVRLASEAHGYTEIMNEGLKRLFKVVLNPSANHSTFLHESAHIFLHLMTDLAARPDAPERLKQDYATVLGWLDAKGPEDLVVKSGDKEDPARLRHEKWARGFERYLLEGKSPSRKLVRMFERFRLWLSKVYRDPSMLRVELSDDIRRVFDRMVATDKEIEAYQNAMGLSDPPLARDVFDHQEDYEKYLEKRIEVTTAATMRLDLEAAKDKLREQEKWWKEELKAEAEKAADEYEKLPERIAQQTLAGKGELSGKGGTAIRLAKERVVEMVGEQAAKKFLVTTKESEKVDPDEVADFTGFGADGKRMLESILALPQKDKWVAATAAERMNEKHPDVVESRAKLKERISKGLHGAATEEYLLMELAKLRIKASKPGARVWDLQVRPVEAIRRAAKDIVEKRAIGRLDTGQTLLAERRSADAALKAAAKGNFAQALAHQQQRLLNFYVWRQLTEAKEEREKFLVLAAKMNRDVDGGRTGRSSKLGKASPVYRDGAAALLEAVGLRPVDPDSEGATIEQVISQMEQDNQVIAIDEDALSRIEAKPRGYKDLTVAEMRVVKDALASINAAAHGATTALYDGKRIDFDELVERMVAEGGKNLPPIPPSPEAGAEFLPELIGGWWQSVDGSMLTAETMLKWLGADDIHSPVFRALMLPLQEAKHKEVEILKGPVRRIVEAFDEMPGRLVGKMSERVDGTALFPGHTDLVPPPQRRWQMLMMLLNSGNESNLKRLTEGRNITEQQIRAAAVKVGITKEEYDWVQSVWDAAEDLKQPAFDLEEKMTGVRPEEIVAKPFQTPYGTMRGGYFPAVYDKRGLSGVGQKQLLSQVMDPKYTPAGTSRGHLKKRADDFADIISLTPQSIYRHLAQVAHDIAFREPVQSVARLLDDDRIKRMLLQRLGDKRMERLGDWVKDVGQGRGTEGNTNVPAFAALMHTLRAGMSISVLGGSLQNAVEDLVTGLVTAAPGSELEAKHLAAGIAAVRGAFSNKAVLEAEAKSGELRTRRGQLSRELLSSISKLIARSPLGRGPLRFVKDHAFIVQEHTDRIVSTAIWVGAERQALAKGESPADAIVFADKIVRGLLPSHHVVDSAAIMRNENIAAMLVFFRYFSTVYNVSRRHGPGFFSNVATPRRAAEAMGFLFGMAILGSLARGQGPDPGEPWDQWFLRKLVSGALGKLPWASELFEMGWSMAVTGGQKREPRNNSIVGMLSGLYLLMERALDGDKEADVRLEAAVKAIGLATGLPVSQPLKMGMYGYRLGTDQLEARGPSDVIGGLTYGQGRNQPANVPTLIQDFAEGGLEGLRTHPGPR